MIDTHCHLTFPELHDRLDDVLAAANRAGVDRMISIGTTPESSRHAADLAASHGHVFATAGIHPHEAGRHHDRNALLDPLREMLALPGVVALGEMGCQSAALAIRWVLEQQGVSSAIVGARTADQLRKSLEAAELSPPAEVLEELTRVSAPPPRYPQINERTMAERRRAALRPPWTKE